MGNKEKLEKAKELYPTANADQRYVLECLFPELAESEDERIRKEMLNVFKQLDEGTTICGRNYDYAKWIAWLEKQGEKKPIIKMKSPEESLGISSKEYNEIVNDCLYGKSSPTDIVEPKFKEGEDERIRKHLINCVTRTIPEADAFKEISKEQILAWLKKQGTSYTKKDVDDAYLKGVCDTKKELEKQGENKQNLANSAKTCKKSQRMISAAAKEALYDKPAWSEEDEKNVKDIIRYLNEFYDGIKCEFEMCELFDKLSWFKSLKERIGR